jgi:hypothetical protein
MTEYRSRWMLEPRVLTQNASMLDKSPGFFMALCWFLYSLCILFTFNEPNRSGLDELRRREAASSAFFADESGPYIDDEEMNLRSSSLSFESQTFKYVSTSNSRYCFKHITRAVALCMSLLFMKRIALESIVGSTSIITKNRYA